MKQYQITYLAKENLKDKPIKDAVSDVKILNVIDNGERQLVYKIKKQSHANFVSVIFEIPEDELIKLNKILATNDEILRFLITTFKEIPMKEKIEDKVGIIEKVIEKETPKPKTKKIEVKKAKKPIATPDVSEEDRLKELDKKLDEILKE